MFIKVTGSRKYSAMVCEDCVKLEIEELTAAVELLKTRFNIKMPSDKPKQPTDINVFQEEDEDPTVLDDEEE